MFKKTEITVKLVI